MIDRRAFIAAAAATLLAARPSAFGCPTPAVPKRVVFVHGRGQGGFDPVALKAAWMEALQRGCQALGRSFPGDVEVAFPYYGDTLDEFVRQAAVPLTADVQSRGVAVNSDFLAFEAELAEELRQGAGITDAQVDEAYGDNPKAKGPQNWEWVQALLRALDQHGGGISQKSIETFTRDVYLYLTSDRVRTEIDRIVAAQLSTEPAVVVGHSLGSVVSYHVLRTDPRALCVPLYVTVGSPLGVRSIRKRLRPLRHPGRGSAWFNAFDERDVVALYPLDQRNFPVSPAVVNYGKVKNHTDNRHGIAGYLDDGVVAGWVLGAL